MQQILYPGRSVSDTEMLLDPGPHLLRIGEGPLGDLLLESLDLSRSQPTGISPIVQDAQLVQALVAEDAEPVSDVAAGDAQQVGDLLACSPFVDPEQGREPLEDAAVAGLPAPLFDLVALLGTQNDGLHRSPPGRWSRPNPCPCSQFHQDHCRKNWNDKTITPLEQERDSGHPGGLSTSPQRYLKGQELEAR